MNNTPDQLTLFDLGVDVSKLRKVQARLLESTAAPNTRTAYTSAWRKFTAWCTDAGRSPLPTTEETVGLYVAFLLDSGLRVTTVTVHLAAIRAAHKAAGHNLHTNGGVSQLLSGARRATATRQPRCKAALTPEEVTAMVQATDTTPRGLRDRALLCIGFASGMRRSEIVGLNYDDIEFKPEGLLLRIVKSKTDQTGTGREIGLMPHRTRKGKPICPIRALQSWLKIRGTKPGPLFISFDREQSNRLTRAKPGTVARAVKSAASAIGLDPARYGAHSLRAGLVTSAIAAGASELAVMQRTGHKQVSTLQRYVRPATAFSVDPLAKAL